MRESKNKFYHSKLPLLNISIIDMFSAVFISSTVMGVSQTILTDIYIGSSFLVTEEQTLNFGSIMTGGSAGYIQIDPTTGQRTINCSACSLASDNFNIGQIKIEGYDLTGVRININNMKIYNSVGNSMDINNFAIHYERIDSNSGLLSIGARMNFSANQKSGDYTGIYNLNIIFP